MTQILDVIQSDVALYSFNSWRYPIRRRVIFASELEYEITRYYLCSCVQQLQPLRVTVGDIDNDLGRNIVTYLKVIALIKTSSIWALSRENLSSVVCDQVRFKPVCSATETSERLESLGLATIGIILQSSEPQNCWSDCVDAQPDLIFCCSHLWHKQVFSWRGSLDTEHGYS